MSTGNDIAWKPIMACVGSGIAGLAIGALLLAPFIEKVKTEKLAEKHKDTKKSA